MLKKLNKRQWAFIGLALLVFASTKLILIKWYLDHREEARPAVLDVKCDPGKASCALPGGGAVSFVTPPARDKAFVIRLSGVGDTAPQASFAMRDMDMGFNRYTFVRDAQGWNATVTLPACVSGGRDWLMTLTANGREYRLPLTAE